MNEKKTVRVRLNLIRTVFYLVFNLNHQTIELLNYYPILPVMYASVNSSFGRVNI
jgi:hypothetical protein